MDFSNLISRANNAFRNQDYKIAIELYQQYAQLSPEHQQRIAINLKLAEARLNKKTEYVGKNNKYAQITEEKIIVYTVNIGGYESVKEPTFIDSSVEYILFTDNKDLVSEHWKVILLTDKLADPRRTSRLPKILAHKYLPEHDISVYIDSSLEITTTNVRKMVSECMEGNDIALYKHYKRNCVYDEIEFVMNSSDRVVADKELCLTALKKYEDINYPRGNGLFENAFIFRRNNEKNKKLNELWWKEYIAGTERDQFTFMYALHVSGINPKAISKGSQFRDNPYTNFYKHSYIAYKPEKGSALADKNLLKVSTGSTSALCSVNWVVGGEDNAGWAYENNAKRFIANQGNFEHVIQSKLKTDIAIYFDVLLFDRMPVLSKGNIVRIGGPRPLNRLCGDDIEKLKSVLQNFHSVICLNKQLANKVSLAHQNVHMIPNGLDLDVFSPKKLASRDSSEFTVGFAGSVKSSTERQVKGLDFVIEACELANVKILNVGRGKGQVQIPHDRMIQDFYSKIDVLVHPVDEGREGSSNVVMEALALGIPVITTEFSGYHAEHLVDGVNYLLCKRKSRHIAGRIKDLYKNSDLREKLSSEGRRFAEQHHDIKMISRRYEELISQANDYKKSKMKICFNPFWYPVDNFATGRIRSSYPAKLLNQVEGIAAKLGYDPDADIVFVSQLADDALLESISKNTAQYVVYDVCDKYYDDERIVGGVNAKSRFYEIVDRANLIVTSTLQLKKDLYELKIDKPIIHIQDGIDFVEFGKGIDPNYNSPKINTIGWFGNPGRGNLDSAAWLLENALELGKEIKLITRRKSVRSYTKLFPHAVEWQYNSFISELQKCDVVLVTHAKNEQNKSPNRMLTALTKGVPVIVSNSQSCAQILKHVGLSWAIVETQKEFENAIELLSKPEIKAMYFKLILPYIESKFGSNALLQKYTGLIENFAHRVTNNRKKVLFVSHNLSIGEGAPTSLYQTIVGLSKSYSVDARVFCPMTGDFKEKYEEQGIPIYNYTKIVSKDSLKPLKSNFEKSKSDFQAYLKRENFELVVCNTAKMLPYASFAIELGIPAISVIRESSDEHIDLTFSTNTHVIDAAKHGLKNVNEVVFVSDVTRKTWQQRQWLPKTRVIHNGIITNQWDYLRSTSKEELRRKLKLPKDKKVLLSVGTINGRKAQIDIVNAYQMLADNVISESYLVLVGARESGYLNLFKQEIDKLPEHIKNNILLVPETDSVGEWYKASDIFVFSSHNESYPRVIVEALYFGLDIISSEVFGVSEQVSSKEKLFEIGNVSQLSSMIGDRIFNNLDGSELNDFYVLNSYEEMLAMYNSLIHSAV